MTFKGSMTTEITKLKNQIVELQNQIDDGERTRSSLKEEKVSLEMKMAEVEEQKEGTISSYMLYYCYLPDFL